LTVRCVKESSQAWRFNIAFDGSAPDFPQLEVLDVATSSVVGFIYGVKNSSFVTLKRSFAGLGLIAKMSASMTFLAEIHVSMWRGSSSQRNWKQNLLIRGGLSGIQY
jgi:hypothetical protein